jgi:hypothetical protein
LKLPNATRCPKEKALPKRDIQATITINQIITYLVTRLDMVDVIGTSRIRSIRNEAITITLAIGMAL